MTLHPYRKKDDANKDYRHQKTAADPYRHPLRMLQGWLPFMPLYVENTSITFEYIVPSAEEFADRIRHTLTRYPYLVAELDGEPAGYAYASAFKKPRCL